MRYFLKYHYISIFLIIFAFLVLAAKQFLSGSGYLSYDSTYYLALSESILNGNGVTLPSRNGNGVQYIAYWPVGYPIIIAAFSEILNIGTFTASKIVSLLSVLISLYLIKKYFKTFGAALMLVMIFDRSMAVFSYSWSEAPFLACLIFFSGCIGRIIGNSSEGLKVPFYPVFFAACFLFLFRYVGIFSIGVISIVLLITLFFKNKRASINLMWVIISVSLFVTIYLFSNKYLTGHLTGMGRGTSSQTIFELLLDTSSSLWEGLWPIILMAPPLLILSKRQLSAQINSKEFYMSASFIAAGFMYISSIVFLRSVSHFDDIGWRLVTPGSILVLIGSFNLLFIFFPQQTKKIKIYISLIALLSLVMHLALAIELRFPGGFNKATQMRLAKYSMIPDGSIVFSRDIYIRYLRPDLNVDLDFFDPQIPSEERWKTNIKTLNPSKKIYVEIGDFNISSQLADNSKTYIEVMNEDGFYNLMLKKLKVE